MAMMNATLLFFFWLYAHYYCFLALCSFFLGFGFIYYYRLAFEKAVLTLGPTMARR